MQAIGFIETRGLIPAIEAADVMLKTSQVDLVEKDRVGGGLITITITGDVAAVKAAVDAGASSVLNFGTEALISQHVIPRPSMEVADKMFQYSLSKEKTIVEQVELEVTAEAQEGSVVEEITEEVIYSIDELDRMSIQELRELAKKVNKMPEKMIMKANKVTLIKHLKDQHPTNK